MASAYVLTSAKASTGVHCRKTPCYQASPEIGCGSPVARRGELGA
jgi:hypothetical protein